MEAFEIKIVERDDRVILVCEGELDIATAPLLDEQLTTAEATSTEMVVVDLDRVSFMDSTGLQVLISHTRPSENGRRVGLTKGSAQVQRLFEITGVLDRLPFVSL
jgi:anti-sigma B factor antagonist